MDAAPAMRRRTARGNPSDGPAALIAGSKPVWGSLNQHVRRDDDASRRRRVEHGGRRRPRPDLGALRPFASLHNMIIWKGRMRYGRSYYCLDVVIVMNIADIMHAIFYGRCTRFS